MIQRARFNLEPSHDMYECHWRGLVAAQNKYLGAILASPGKYKNGKREIFQTSCLFSGYTGAQSNNATLSTRRQSFSVQTPR
jgi:hypothetical protein